MWIRPEMSPHSGECSDKLVHTQKENQKAYTLQVNPLWQSPKSIGNVRLTKECFHHYFFSWCKLHHFFLEIAVVSLDLFQYWRSMQGGSVSPTSALRPFLHRVEHSLHFTPRWNLPPISVKALYFPLSSPRPCFAIYHFALLSDLASFQSACIYPSQYESDPSSGPLLVRRWHHLHSLHALIS